MGLLKVLFLINFPAFIFGEVIRVSVFNIEIRFLDVTSVILFIFWSTYCVRNKEISRIIRFPILLFIIFAFASLMLNFLKLSIDQFAISMLYFLRWTAYAGFFYIAVGFDKDFKYLIKKMLLFSGVVVVLLGYIQYFFYNDLSNLYYLGWDEHLYRMFSVFLDPNFAGAFFVLYLLFVINEIFKIKYDKFKLFIYGVLAVSTLIAILLTYSRSAFLMLIVGIGLFLFLKQKTLLIFGIIFIFAILTLLLPKAYKTEGTNFFRTVSSEARIGSYYQGISIFKESPIYGVGFNAYRFAKERSISIAAKPNIGSHADSSNDNSFIFVLATTGVFGLTVFIYMWYRLLKLNKKSAVIISSVIALFVNSLFINSLFYTPLLFWIWTLMGIKENK